MALAVPLSRFTSPVGGGSAFFVRPLEHVIMKKLFPEYLDRGQYFIRWLLWMVLVFIGIYSGLPVPPLIFMLFILRFVFMDIPRFRSIGRPPWYVVLLLIPLVNLYFQIVLLAEAPFYKLPTTAKEIELAKKESEKWQEMRAKGDPVAKWAEEHKLDNNKDDKVA